MRNMLIAGILVASGLGVAALPGCDGNKGSARSHEQSLAQASATLTQEGGAYKSAAGKPVRLFKVSIPVPAGEMKREHLLIIVGDANAAVSMPNASTVDIGGKKADLRMLSTDRNITIAISAEDPAKSQKVNDPDTESWRPPLPSDPNAPIPDVGFPMELVKAKISGGVVRIDVLDKL